MMTPEEWFNLIVYPNYTEFQQDPGDWRKGINAALTTHHFGERVYHYCKANSPSRLGDASREKSFLERLARETPCRDLLVLRDVADASKHHFLRRPGVIRAATDVFPESGRIMIGDTGRDLLNVLRVVVGFWIDWVPIPDLERSLS